MSIWIALLRGINVGGNNLLPMKDLVAVLEELGCTNVSTYIQSGNVVFERPRNDAMRLSKRIGNTVLKNHSFKPRTLVLTADEFENAVVSNPFPDAEVSPKSLQIFFLSEEPTSPEFEMLNSIKSRNESYALIEKVFYLHAPDGIGRSKLAARVEKLLGVNATARNWRTVSKLLEMARRSNNATA